MVLKSALIHISSQENTSQSHLNTRRDLSIRAQKFFVMNKIFLQSLSHRQSIQRRNDGVRLVEKSVRRPAIHIVEV